MMATVTIRDWPVGRKAVMADHDHGVLSRSEFDTDIESDGQRWVYVYRRTYVVGPGGHIRHITTERVRRIPMGQYYSARG